MQLNIKNLGAAGDGQTDDSAIIQSAIDSLSGVGGTIYFPKGVYNVGQTGIFLHSSNVRLIGDGKGTSTLKYSGSSAAVLIGNTLENTYSINLENLTVDLSLAKYSAVGIHAIRYWWLNFYDVEIKTIMGGPIANGQTAVKLDGAGGFSVYGYFENCVVRGDFTRGYYLVGGDGIQLANNNTWVGGSAVQTSVGIPSSIGLHIEHGDTNCVQNTDFEGWQIAVKVDDNYNGPFNVRTEGCSVGIQINARHTQVIGGMYDSIVDTTDKSTTTILSAFDRTQNGHVNKFPANFNLETLKLGLGTKITKHLSSYAQVRYTNPITAGLCSDTTVAFAGVSLGDSINVTPASSVPAGLMFQAWVSATNTITVRCFNGSGAEVTPVTSLRFDIWRH